MLVVIILILHRLKAPNSPAFSAGLGNVNPALVNLMEYGDCTLGSMMGPFCMVGESTGMSAMAGTPRAIEITSAVPVPAAFWLFASALGLFGIKKRKIA